MDIGIVASSYGVGTAVGPYRNVGNAKPQVQLNRSGGEAPAGADNVRRNTVSGGARASETGYSRLGVNMTGREFNSAVRKAASFSEFVKSYVRESLNNLYTPEGPSTMAATRNVDWTG